MKIKIFFTFSFKLALIASFLCIATSPALAQSPNPKVQINSFFPFPGGLVAFLKLAAMDPETIVSLCSSGGIPAGAIVQGTDGKLYICNLSGDGTSESITGVWETNTDDSQVYLTTDFEDFNVGIGENDPVARLQVKGDLLLTGNTNPEITISRSTNLIYMDSSKANFTVGTDTAGTAFSDPDNRGTLTFNHGTSNLTAGTGSVALGSTRSETLATGSVAIATTDTVINGNNVTVIGSTGLSVPATVTNSTVIGTPISSFTGTAEDQIFLNGTRVNINASPDNLPAGSTAALLVMGDIQFKSADKEVYAVGTKNQNIITFSGVVNQITSSHIHYGYNHSTTHNGTGDTTLEYINPISMPDLCTNKPSVVLTVQDAASPLFAYIISNTNRNVRFLVVNLAGVPTDAIVHYSIQCVQSPKPSGGPSLPFVN